MKNPKLVIGIIAIVVLLIIFFVVLANSKKKTTDKSGNTVQQAGLFDSFLALFQPKGTSTSSGAGTGLGDAWCKIFPKSCCKPGTGYCNCCKPGFANDGTADTNCEKGKMLFEQDCAA